MKIRGMLFVLLVVIAVTTEARRKKQYKGDFKGRVISVNDGDTARVQDLSSKKIYKVRFNYIDSPENSQKYGKQAGALLRKMFKKHNNYVRVVYKSKDYFGRILGNVYLGQTNLSSNFVMVQQGGAWCYKNRCPKKYKDAMMAAWRAGKGLWASAYSPAVKPWSYRKCVKKQRSKKNSCNGKAK